MDIKTADQTDSLPKTDRVKIGLKITAEADQRLRDNAHVQKRDMSDIASELFLTLPEITIRVESLQS